MMELIPIFVVLPAIAAFLIPLFGKDRVLPGKTIAGSVSLVLAGLSVYSLLSSGSGILVYRVGGWISPIGINFVSDGFSRLMVFIINFSALVLAVYSFDYMAKFTGNSKYYTLMMLMITGLNGVVLTGDLFNLYLFTELTALSCYALVAFGLGHAELEASLKYLVLGTIGSLFIMLGIVFLYGFASSFNLADISREAALYPKRNLLIFVSALFVAGYGIKCAIVPFHAWLPDAHPSAPAPVSAILSGVVIKVLGIYVIARLFYNIFGSIHDIGAVLMLMGVCSMILGAVLAFMQDDSKRLLAYSSISQVGYILFGFGLATPLGVLGAVFHMLNHSTMKSLLFLNAGAVEYATGSRLFRELKGLIKRMPVTGITSLTASMSVAGIPPFSGFWSKLIIIVAAVKAQSYVYAFIAAAVSIITLGYFMKFEKGIFFGELNDKCSNAKEAPFFMKSSMIVLAVMCVLLGILLIPAVFKHTLEPAVEALMQGTNYASIVLRGH